MNRPRPPTRRKGGGDAAREDAARGNISAVASAAPPGQLQSDLGRATADCRRHDEAQDEESAEQQHHEGGERAADRAGRRHQPVVNDCAFEESVFVPAHAFAAGVTHRRALGAVDAHIALAAVAAQAGIALRMDGAIVDLVLNRGVWDVIVHVVYSIPGGRPGRQPLQFVALRRATHRVAPTGSDLVSSSSLRCGGRPGR